MARVFIGLGSNIGDRFKYLQEARNALNSLQGFKVLSVSSVEETDPVGYLLQPKFLNQVIMGETDYSPERLLEILLSIEKKLGRNRTVKRGPRTIDLDILLYDNIIMQTAHLTIPHPEIRNRPFVLKHLLELDETLVDPLTGEYYKEVYQYATNSEHKRF